MFDDELLSQKEIDKRLAKLIACACQPDVFERREAVEAISELCWQVHSKASAAVEVLISCLPDADEKTGESASWALSNCAPDSIDSLIACLRHLSPLARERACHALGNIGADAISAAAELRALLRDDIVAVRAKAAWALGLMRDVHSETIAVLFAMAASTIAEDRSAALHALGSLGKALESPPSFRAKLPLVEDALRDESEDVRWSACYLLSSMGLEKSRYVDLLMEQLDIDASSRVRTTVASDLKELASEVDLGRHMSRLIRILKRGSPDASDICELLESRGHAARDAVGALQESISSENERLAIRAAVALWRIDRQIDAALPRLAALMDDNPESVCDAICQIGTAAEPLLPSVLRAMEIEDWDCQWAATDALAALVSSKPESIAALVKALGHESHIVKPAAAKALSRIGEPAVAALMQLLRDENDSRFEWACDALCKIGPAAMPAADLLRAGSKSSNPTAALWAGFGVAMVAGDPMVVPMLLKSIKDDDSYLREMSVRSLAAIRPLPDKAIDAIQRALHDENDEVRGAAEDAIRRVKAPLH